jgi:transcriptional regulator with XRE-family HTH domain
MDQAAQHPDRSATGLPTALRDSIRTARRDCGLTQREVAHKVGITVRSVSGWECGKAIPHLETLVALARALGQEPEWFTAAAQAVTARRRAVRVRPAAVRIEGALSEVVHELRVRART